MLACTDTYYSDKGSRTALVLFENWTDSVAVRELSSERDADSADYVPGEFYRRELPCILAAIAPVRSSIETVVIDGYVTLDKDGRKGLGAHLYESLNQEVAVIGVAKTSFAGNDGVEVFRGNSRNPLIVTAVGLTAADAAKRIQQMAGNHRIPTLLKRADYVSRYGP